jgi:transcriptional regulator with XRE-family HTH domain
MADSNEGIALALRKVGGVQRELAEKLGIDQSTISRYLSGSLPVPVRVALRIEKEMGVPRALIRPDVFKESDGKG